MIQGNTVGGIGLERTYIVEDDAGTSVVITKSDYQKLTATANDIRKGKVAAVESGIIMGEKVIPGYMTHEGVKFIRPGAKFEISLVNENQYDYTLLQCLLCDFNTNIDDSVATSKVVIGDHVYKVEDTNLLATVMKNHDKQSIDLGIVNDTDEIKILRYFTCKEIY